MPKGEYYTPTPLDFAILENLPEKGILGGLRWAGRPAKYVREDINRDAPKDLAVTISEVQARLRSMHVEGHIEPFAGSGGSKIWARTEKGTAFLADKEEVLGL